MHILIDIPEDEYNKICSGNFDIDGYFKMNLKEAFRNAIPLPKGHGKLVDLDQMCEDYWDGNYMEIHFNDLDNIKTIIEADNKSERENV